MADITDGLSTTMMVMETNFKNGPWGAGGFPSVRGTDPDGPNYLGYIGQFGSLHRTEETFLFKTYPECSNCIFVDGSVRFLTKNIDPTTFEALATIAGGKKVELPVDY